MPKKFQKEFIDYCNKYDLEINQNQIEVIKNLEKFYKKNSKSFFSKIFSKDLAKKSFYLFGDVGVGKTMILNFFFERIEEKKLRQHFNEFMLDFHEFVHKKKEKNEENVINQFVKNLKSKASLIYFDEFQVTNIVDAMILGKLFEIIFAENLKIIISTNTRLKELYKDGLQRDQFLPFIDLINERSIQKELVIENDYRKKGEDKLQRAYFPITEINTFKINKLFREITREKNNTKLTVITKGRKFEILNHYEGVIRLNFNELCDVNFGSEEYLNIALKCKILFLENIPNFSDENADLQQRFITLIDIFYDKKVPLIISLVSSLENLKSSIRLKKNFERTLSRLYELTSPKFKIK